MQKTIKFLVLCIVVGTISRSVFAEENKIRFGVKGGVNASTTSVSLSEYASEYYLQNSTEYKYNAGFNVGMLVEFPLTKTLSFQPELALSVKGMRNESYVIQNRPSTTGIEEWELHARSKISSYYIELPLYLKFGFDLNRSDRFIAGAGPYFAYGASGKMKAEFVLSELQKHHWLGEKNIFKEDDINFNESTWVGGTSTANNVASWVREPYWRKSLKRFDGGVSGFIGYELHKKWFITATYDLGLINFLNSAEAWDGKVEGKMYNRTFSISLGYKF